MGKIHLDVVFGDPANFRKEKLEFEVVDWPSQYHAILGRPTFARFMAVPHYAYLLLKMPGPNSTITVRGDYQKSDSYDRDFNKISESFGMHEELSQLSSSIDYSLPPVTQSTTPDREFNKSSDTRTHQMHPTDPTKTAIISANLLR